MTITYTTQLIPKHYELLYSLLPSAKTTGRPRTVNMMWAIQGILYVLVTGCAWRLLNLLGNRD
ncbi:transposase [Myxosarcina sp. GI1]|uniref:transposase n=1 Tax=Myxosarcina sp. GI1 TaxID=1541065 RepID=UPI000907CF0D|nr:transposase [Myxosarcina sp. GI1]